MFVGVFSPTKLFTSLARPPHVHFRAIVTMASSTSWPGMSMDDLGRRLLPPLHCDRKGQDGRVVVFGGSEKYTGAPFFGGMASLLCGVDIVHIVCEAAAALPIKSYSPELIVHPTLDTDTPDFPYANAALVGPGLGTDPSTQAAALDIMRECFRRRIPLVIDADGLRCLADMDNFTTTLHDREDPELVILTPNAREYEYLNERAGIEAVESSESGDELIRRYDRSKCSRKG